MPIMLSEILNIKSIKDYKVHCGTMGEGEEHPEEALDAFVDGRWDDWQKPWKKRERFTRDFIFTMMRFYSDQDDTIWLFGGIYEVINRRGKNDYDVRLTKQFKDYIGRIKFKLTNKRYPYPNLETLYSKIEIIELFREPYGGIPFAGYEKIHLSFNQLKAIIDNQSKDWHGALRYAKGVYLITDTNTGKKYVGSAYGNPGIWGRWSQYVNSLHGGNKGLKALLNRFKPENALGYVRKNFTYALLEYCPKHIDKDAVIARENHWKDILLTREHKYGYNKN